MENSEISKAAEKACQMAKRVKLKKIVFSVADDAEEIKENTAAWFEKHAKELKKAGIKTAAMLLTTATLLTAGMGLTGCQNTGDPKQPSISIPAEISTRSPEEIAETGVTAEDVLAELDLLCRDLLRKEFLALDEFNGTNKVTDEVLNNINAQFTTFTTLGRSTNGEYKDSIAPYYYKNPEWDNEGRWLGSRFILNPTAVMFNNYGMQCNFVGDNGEVQETVSYDFNIPADIFENLMQNLDIPSSTLTEDDCYEHRYFIDMIYKGAQIYPGTEINREYIKSLDSQKLTAFYNFIKDSYPFISEELTQEKIDSLDDTYTK